MASLRPEDDEAARIILIAGPTASGKSALALGVAAERGGVVINADSMQVYRDLRILTARPDAEEEARVPHRLYGFVDAAVTYSVGQWLHDVRREIARARAEGRTAVIAGGTGLYFHALEHGLAEIPEVPADIRGDLRKRMDREGPEALHAILETRDAEAAARIRSRDRQRIPRALEVVEATGRPLSAWQREAHAAAPLAGASALRIVLAPPREVVYRRADERFDAMLKAGALDEVRALADRKLDPRLPATKALGVPQLIAHVEGRLGLEEAIETTKTQTRRYAKRQMTWMRGNMTGWTWIRASHIEAARDRVLAAAVSS